MTQEQQLIIEQQGKLGIIRLNRVASLNALSIEMIHGIHQQVLAWQHDADIEAILLTSNSPKAFSAGGDIRYIYDGYYAGENKHLDYFADEYAMLNDLYASKKPLIAVLDGYVLGGGFGLAQACQIKISSEKSRFAMPETVIGYFPDVAATYFLAQLKQVGVYLALTGEQITAADAVALKLVDYHVTSADLAEFEHRLSQAAVLNAQKIGEVALALATPAASSPLLEHITEIEQYFSASSVREIEAALAESEHAWAQATLAILQQRSPVAKRVSLQLQQLGQQLTLPEAMQLERDVQGLWFEQGDFIEGVRALIIDKDKQPKWRTDEPELEQKIRALLIGKKALIA